MKMRASTAAAFVAIFHLECGAVAHSSEVRSSTGRKTRAAKAPKSSSDAASAKAPCRANSSKIAKASAAPNTKSAKASAAPNAKSSKSSKGSDYVPPYENIPIDCSSGDTSLWGSYVCSLSSVELQAQCEPRFGLHPGSRRRKARGLIVAFHGYSACPDSFDEMAVRWLKEDYDVMVPLLPGQGRAQGDCKDNELGTLSDDGLCAGTDRVDDLPLSLQGYIDFVQMVNEIVVQERQNRGYNQVIVTGLSHGGPLATYAVNTAQDGVYQKLFIMNPSFAATNPPLDRQFVGCVNSGTPDCVAVLIEALLLSPDDVVDDRGAGGILEILGIDDETVQAALETVDAIAIGPSFSENTEEQKYSIIQFIFRRLLTTVVENFDQLPVSFQDQINSSVYSWGNQCEVHERGNGRGGICSFLTRNVLAAHSFGQVALRTMARSSSSKVNVWQIVATERDAVSRNTLVFQAGMSQRAFLQSGNGNVCIYQTVCDPDEGGNDCGVPHSMLSAAEQELQGERYWIRDLIQGSVDFFRSNAEFGKDASSVSDPLAVRTICQSLEITGNEPSFDLSLPLNRGLWLRFEATGAQSIDLAVESDIAREITDFLGLLDGQIQLVDQSTVPFPSEDDEMAKELYLEVPAPLELVELQKLEKNLTEMSGLLDEVVPEGVSLLQVEIAGRTPVDKESEN